MGQESIGNVIKFLAPLAVIIASVGIGYGVKKTLDRYRRSREAGDAVRVDQMVLKAIDGLVMFWFALIGTMIALQVSILPAELQAYADMAIAALLTVSVTLGAARVLTLVIRHYLVRVEALSQVVGVIQRIGEIAIWTIGVMVSLSYLGVPITPLLTTLGVGGLATALALQDTLANFFAGFYVLVDRPIRVGDYIKLDTGDEGYVVEIGWRSAKIRALPNNLVIIPNQKLSQSIITNYHLPEQRMSLLIPVGVSYDNDPEKVEKILVEVATEASKEVEGMLGDPAPFVRFIPGFGEYSLDFTLICQVREFVDQYYVQHELRKRIFARFRQESIEIPFPIRTLHLSDGLDDRKAMLQASMKGARANEGA